ncbi:MAG: pilus assembly protein cpaE [Pseudomonadota bacterium]|jgi:pilus assembly protein CpaE
MSNQSNQHAGNPDAEVLEQYQDEAYPADQYEQDDTGYDQGAVAPYAEVADAGDAALRARPIPRISIQAFCEDPSTADAIQAAAEDRRLAKAHVAVHMGGIPAATAHYQDSPTPNLIMVECAGSREQLISELDQLAECCDSGTKVIIIGHMNDVVLYRELLKRGVSEYVVAPVRPIQLMETISNLYNDPDADPVGNVMAFIGAKGGVGSSTICHNVSWILSEAVRSDVCIADLDLAFGTTGLDFNQDPVQGIAEALSSPERLDEVLLDRLLTKCTDHLSIFAAPVILDRDYDISADACDMVIDVVRQNVPYVMVDLPHTWSAWTKNVLLNADEVVIVAAPDLANLRNAKNIIDLVKTSRNNDGPPHLVINMANMPKRQEIPVKEFCSNLDLQPTVVIEYDSETFSTASNNGQMIQEVNAKAPAVVELRDLAMALIHRRETRVEQKKSGLAPLLEKFGLKR